MKMRIIGEIAVAIVVSAILPAAAIAGPQVFIYTDKSSYQAGDTIEVSLAGENYGEGMNVDVYIGLLTPEGALWTLGELVWWEGIGPWIRDIYLSSEFNMDRTPFFCFPLPCEMPPIHEPGQFCFLAGLSHPGTFDFASAINAAPFEVVQVPRDYYVDAELGGDANDGAEDAPWRTITHALDRVIPSELSPVIIHLAAGTYSASASGESFPLNMKSWVSLLGEGADVAVLDAGGASSSVIYCFEADHSIIEGFTITGGDADRGGGICCVGGSPTITHNTISGNSAGDGGGIYYDATWPNGPGWPTISDNVISENSAKRWGGGVHCRGTGRGYARFQDNTIEKNGAACGGGISFYLSQAVISANTIRSNSAGDGGGVYCYMGLIMVLDNSITDNSASHGGGLCCNTGGAKISHNTVSWNRAYYSGGGIFSLVTDLVLTDNRIVGNSSGQAGGGLCCDDAIVSNNIISDNTTQGDGGGISGQVLMFNNNTIAGNVAAGRGGGIYTGNYTRSYIVDSILWNNGDDLENCTATFCCVRDPDEGTGNIHADPMFVRGPLGDYYLDPGSPCIDAGSRSAEDAGLSDMTTQADGTPDTGTVDIGCHLPILSQPFPTKARISRAPNPQGPEDLGNHEAKH